MDNKKDIDIDFLVVGAQKSATSWLFECLNEHPLICVPPEKEVHFFSDKYEEGIESYKSRFIECADRAKKGEASTSYFSHVDAPSRISKVFPDVKIIVILRNPIDRIFSHIRHLQSKGLVSSDFDLKNVLEKFPDTIENGMYGKHLKNYYKYFSKDNVLVLFFDEIEEDSSSFIKKVYNFLDVDSNFVPKSLNIKFNTSNYRSSIFFNKINKIYFIFSKNKIGSFFIKVFKKMGLRARVVEKILSKDDGKKEKTTDSTKEYLKSIYANDLRELESLLNMKLDFWK